MIQLRPARSSMQALLTKARQSVLNGVSSLSARSKSEFGDQLLAATDGACDLLGYSRPELLEKRVPDIVVETDAADRYNAMIQTRQQDGTITLRRKDGSNLEAHYEARETQVSGLEYFMAILRPLKEV